MRTLSLALLSGLVALAAALQWGGPAAATNHTSAASTAAYTATVVGNWQMDERSGQVMADTSGNGLDGYIGTSVVTRWSTGSGGTAYHFAGPLTVQNRERLATVDETDALDPGTGTYSVIVRFRTTGRDPTSCRRVSPGTPAATGSWSPTPAGRAATTGTSTTTPRPSVCTSRPTRTRWSTTATGTRCAASAMLARSASTSTRGPRPR